MPQNFPDKHPHVVSASGSAIRSIAFAMALMCYPVTDRDRTTGHSAALKSVQHASLIRAHVACCIETLRADANLIRQAGDRSRSFLFHYFSATFHDSGQLTRETSLNIRLAKSVSSMR